jgi:hypothetical protein
MYAAETTVAIVSGKNARYDLLLKWVGPTGPPYGSMQMKVVLGAIGTTTVNGILEGPPSMFAMQCTSTPDNACASATACNLTFNNVCCCECKDPANEHDYNHVLDLEKTVDSCEVAFEMKPQTATSGCLTDGYMYYSLDGKTWTKFWYKAQAKAGDKIQAKVMIKEKVKYIRTATDGCAADWTYVNVVQK